MSILPSRLTSATATPSERKTLSMWVFFHEMEAPGVPAAGLSSPGAAGTRATSATRKKAGSQKRFGMVGTSGVGRESVTGHSGSARAAWCGDDYRASPGGVQQVPGRLRVSLRHWFPVFLSDYLLAEARRL